MTRRRVLAVAAVTLIAVGAGWRLVGRSAPRAAGAGALGLAPMGDDELHYRVTWRGTSDAPGTGELAQLGAGDARGDVDLAGELAIRHLAGPTLGVRLIRVERATLTAFGRPLLDPTSAAALIDREVAVDVDPTGAVVSLAVPADAPPALLPIMRAIAVQMQVHRWLGRSYQIKGRTLFGEVTYAYQRVAGGLHRTRVRYDQLDAIPLLTCVDCTQAMGGDATITLARDGSLARLHDLETLTITRGAPVLTASNEFLLEATGRAHAPVRPAIGGWTRVAIGGIVDDEQARMRELVAGLTFADVDGWIIRLAATGTEPLDPMWLARATALLALEPAHLDDLVVRFGVPGQPDAARLMILDLLANTPGARAQAALCTALDDGEASDDQTYAAMLNRLMLVRVPGAATIAWVAGLRERVADRGLVVRGTALYVEGTVIGELAPSDRPAALAMGRALVDELRAEAEPSARAHLVTALGNADLDELVPDVVAHAADPDPRVRAAAAHALTTRVVGEGGPTLVALAADPDPSVQAAALHTLGNGRAPDDLLASLAAHAPVGADRQLVDALAPGAGRLPAVDDTLRVVLARSPHDPELSARVRSLLGE